MKFILEGFLGAGAIFREGIWRHQSIPDWIWCVSAGVKAPLFFPTVDKPILMMG